MVMGQPQRDAKSMIDSSSFSFSLDHRVTSDAATDAAAGQFLRAARGVVE